MFKTRSVFLTLLSLFPLISTENLSFELIAILDALIILSIFFKIPKILIYGIIIFCSYYLKTLFGVFFVPESMITFLALMCLARILTGKKDDKTNRILGFLWMGCFLLFRTDLLGLIILVFGSYFILKTVKLTDDLLINLKDIFSVKFSNFKETLLGLLIITILFIFFPRIYGFLPGVRNQQTAKIGYSKEVNNSSASNLTPSSQTAFIAQIKELTPEQLYWRGRIHSVTDGYNWRTKELVARKYQASTKTPKELIQYQIKYEQNFFGDIIMLDIPWQVIDSNLGIYRNKESATFSSYMKDKKLFITGSSVLKRDFLEFDPKNNEHYLQLPAITSKTIEPIIKVLDSPKDLNELSSRFEKYLQTNQFSYNLSAPNSSTLKDFINNKQGFCTHYASLFGLILRFYKYPTRLVSGFQGGEYNKIGEHYKISSNDAHTWVEVYDNGLWKRIDPTSFIAPNRIIQGGEAFLLGNTRESKSNSQNAFMNFYYNTKQYWDNLNFKISLFLDTFDRDKQNDLGIKFKLKRAVFITIGLILLILVVLFFYFLKDEKHQKLNEIDIYFNRFVKILGKQGIKIEKQDNLLRIKAKIESVEIKNKNKLLSFLESYEKNKYSKEKSFKQYKELFESI